MLPRFRAALFGPAVAGYNLAHWTIALCADLTCQLAQFVRADEALVFPASYKRGFPVSPEIPEDKTRVLHARELLNSSRVDDGWDTEALLKDLLRCHGGAIH